MTTTDYELIGDNYTNTSDVPKDDDLYYECLLCGATIPSVPDDNVGCECGSVFIDKDCWRLEVGDFSKFRVLKRKK